MPDGGTLKFPEGAAHVTEEVVLNKNVNISGHGVTFEKMVSVDDAEVVLNNVVLTASGTSANDKAIALKVSGTKPFTLKNSIVNGSARTAVNIMTSGEVTIEDNTFDAGNQNIYNMIEFSISNARDITGAIIKNNTFKGELKNNGVCFYNLAEGAEINIVGNDFKDINVNNNPVRLSNPKNVSAVFNIKDNTYNYTSETSNADGYTGFMLLQDYTKDGVQDFSKFNITFDNLKRGSKHLTEKGTGIDQVFYVYDDQKGILADGVNDPTVSFK